MPASADYYLNLMDNKGWKLSSITLCGGVYKLHVHRSVSEEENITTVVHHIVENAELNVALHIAWQTLPDLESKDIEDEFVDADIWNCPMRDDSKCRYNKTQDPALDNCIWCGEPYERK